MENIQKIYDVATYVSDTKVVANPSQIDFSDPVVQQRRAKLSGRAKSRNQLCRSFLACLFNISDQPLSHAEIGQLIGLSKDATWRRIKKHTQDGDFVGDVFSLYHRSIRLGTSPRPDIGLNNRFKPSTLRFSFEESTNEVAGGNLIQEMLRHTIDGKSIYEIILDLGIIHKCPYVHPMFRTEEFCDYHNLPADKKFTICKLLGGKK